MSDERYGRLLTIVDGGTLNHDIAWLKHVIDRGDGAYLVMAAKGALADTLLRELDRAERVDVEVVPLTDDVKDEILRFVEMTRSVDAVHLHSSAFELQRIEIANAVLTALGVYDVLVGPDDDVPADAPAPSRVVRRSIPFLTRAKVLARDGFTCVACASVIELQIDHKIPLAKGGTDDESNLQTLCGRCNRKKGARLEGE